MDLSTNLKVFQFIKRRMMKFRCTVSTEPFSSLLPFRTFVSLVPSSSTVIDVSGRKVAPQKEQSNTTPVKLIQ